MKLPLPPILEKKLADFRQRVWAVKLTEAFLAASAGLTASYLLVFGLERISDTPVWLRLSLLFLGTGTLVIGVPLKWYRWVWKQRSLEDAARLLRRTFPRLGDQLLGIVELAASETTQTGRSERLVQAAMEQAAQAVKDKDFTHAVPDAKHKRWATAAILLLAIAGASVFLSTQAARNTLVRWLFPWASVDRFTFTKIVPLPRRLVVPIAEPFELPVQLSADTQRSPKFGNAIIGNQTRVSAPLESNQYLLHFPPQKIDSILSLSLGDLRQSIRLCPKPRPELTDIGVHLRLPAYLGYQDEQQIAIRGGSVYALKGAQVSFVARAGNPLSSAELDDQAQPVSDNQIQTSYIPVSADFSRRLFWKDTEGLTPRDPLILKIHALDDEPPRIAAKRESLEQVVLDSEVVTFDLQSSDDFGVKNIGLEWHGALKPHANQPLLRGEKIAAAGGFQTRDISARATFCATREGVPPQTIEIRAWADDYLPERTHSYSAAFTLHILNKTDHALWLIEQLAKWLEAAKEGYDREQQLHQSNLELQNLTATELDRFENRKRIALQSAAESANAARLDTLTQNGRALLEQATRNNEFDAQRLESWATMVKSLSDISATRMPNVAALLKQTANAATQAPPPSPVNPSPNADLPQDAQFAPKTNSPAPPDAPQPDPTQPSDKRPTPPAPSPSPQLASNESGLTKPETNTPSAQKPPQKQTTATPFGLPATTLDAAKTNKQEAQTKPDTSPAQEKLETAIKEQKDLLAEFAKVADQLNAILGSLEASTFVKRLKEASRQQIRIGTEITQKTLSSFGVARAVVQEAVPIAKSAKNQGEIVSIIQSDLDAYTTRKQDKHLQKVLEEMKKVEVVNALSLSPEKLLSNLTGQSVSAAEFWADTLDRWAEELVATSKSKPSSSGTADSLPPEIVLKVMQSLRDEIKLRDETREAENARPSLAPTQFQHTAEALTFKQLGISKHTESALSDILAIPDANSKFPQELKLLQTVLGVMGDAGEILKSLNTGPTAVAAESEAIELLLQTKRNKAKPEGGGAGAAPGEGGRAATASSTALSDLGPGGNTNSAVTTRAVGQATGHSGKEFPAEFKTGLDAYFNLLENAAK